MPARRIAGKRVSFAPEAELETTYLVESYEIDHKERDTAGNDTSTASATTNSSRLSDSISLLSTLHEKSRRYLREIDNLDEEAAVLYGKVTPGYPDPKTKLPRYKYIFGDTVLITDHTSKVKVTCYKQPVSIPRAPISPDMINRHHEVKLIVRDEPWLCMSHTIVILDQSGSMRTADVNGFRSRSHAAYGSLALDYVAEQLYQQQSDVAGVDTFTLIEMNDEGTIVFKNEPLDWILFNKLLDRQVCARPRSHGNYADSLRVASRHIRKERKRLGEIDHEELPNFCLVVLSDGKPSDNDLESVAERDAIVRSLCNVLKDKLTVFGMGLGARGLDFVELKGITSTAEECGARGCFNHAGLSAANLGSGFSAVSSTMSSLRSELLSNVDGVEEEDERKVVPLKYRQSFSKSWEDCYKITHGVTRYEFNYQRWRKYEDPWDRIQMNSGKAVGFAMDKTPFGKGAERLAFRFQEITSNYGLVGKTMVAKESKKLKDESRKKKFHEYFCRSQLKAYQLAGRFNEAVRRTPSLTPIQQHERLPRISFLKCHVYEFTDEKGQKSGVLVERLLEGKWTKYTHNDGSSRVTSGGRAIEIANGTILAVDFLHAFSHWSYVYTDHKLLVCDLQGVFNEEGRAPVFELTDPAISSCYNKRQYRFGKTDLGWRAMRRFCHNHKCNLVCQSLGLAAFGTRKRDTEKK